MHESPISTSFQNFRAGALGNNMKAAAKVSLHRDHAVVDIPTICLADSVCREVGTRVLDREESSRRQDMDFT